MRKLVSGICGFMIFAGGCASTGGASTAGAANSAKQEIPRLLEQQAKAWNAGKIDEFMSVYWNSPELSFTSAGKVTRGWQPMLDYYKKQYPTREAMGFLIFDKLEIMELGGESALVLGRWRIQGNEPTGGAFSVLFRRFDGRWVIVHDHTSRDEAWEQTPPTTRP